MVGQKAGVRGQGVVGKNRIVVGGAGAGSVLARRGVLFERCREVQVLVRNGDQHSVELLHQLFKSRSLRWNGVPALAHQHVQFVRAV